MTEVTVPASGRSLEDEAEAFVRQFHDENPDAGPPGGRLEEVRRSIGEHGTYAHTSAELAHAARVAWRNSKRCIGRLYWRNLVVRDRRHVNTAEGVYLECVAHLRHAFAHGRIRPMITVFARAAPGCAGPRIHNEQLVRYAGYRRDDGTVLGDPRNAALTERVMKLGWPGGPGTSFDPLPLLVETPGERPRLFDLPAESVHEVPIGHPDLPWFGELGLRWHAVPAISDMTLLAGGLRYPAAPFNGWYMGTEIGARNLADDDRYAMLPEIAHRMGLSTAAHRTLWKDRALVELNVAVLWSFQRSRVTMSDHHTEAERFMRHLERERRAGRRVPAEWAWIVPPLSGAATPVFHRYYDDMDLLPNFIHR
ncbi:nitric oxide synthase oxygenase [Nonomuraea basaltis]|uniref:nitric oxide synthase oxygenase n=1 Tax=Nonomuraea basaltis TaxID=2495887 RepID=UPI00110C5B45|nr:nitric oxide synthase oxygenase [Nonomuraea basaltis]TMR88473.1 nitric oxide synthase oxygenase [Nonomuraea basaltis]